MSLISSTPENNRKVKPCANLPCFTAIFIDTKMWLVPVELVVLDTDTISGSSDSAQPLVPLDPYHGLTRQLTPFYLVYFA